MRAYSLVTIVATVMCFVDARTLTIWFAEEPDEDDEDEYDEDPIDVDERIIFPFTHWCGHGNIAKNTSHLGVLKATDACCRTHDMCDDIIPPGRSAHGLKNTSSRTKLHCKCDIEFRKCLRKSADKVSAFLIEKLYFQFVPAQCFKYDFPIIRCIKYGGLLAKRCSQYKLDTSKRKVYQWFDIPPFMDTK